MSERIRTTQPGNAALDEQTDLNGLSASKDLHTQTQSTTRQSATSQTDFSEASISTTNILRVSPKVEPRKDVTNVSSTQALNTEHEISRSTSKAKSQGSKGEHGIFTNPAYKYSGGIFSRIISFIANILKALERLFLRLLAGPDNTTPMPRPQTPINALPKTKATAANDDREERESQEKAQAIHRS